MNFALKTFLTERIEETLSGYRADVVMNIYGNDLEQLDRQAGEAARDPCRHARGKGRSDAVPSGGAPQVAIELRPYDVARWGFDPVTVMDAMGTAFRGTTAGQVYDGNRVFDVTVILSPRERQSN